MGTQPGVGNPETAKFRPENVGKPVKITVEDSSGIRTFSSYQEMMDAMREERDNKDSWN